MNNKMLLAALSQDLYRAAIGWHTGSEKMAERFSHEALKTADLIDKSLIKPHIVKILDNLPQIFAERNTVLRAEDTLTYSILIQNSAVLQKNGN